jgi:hypothetical protein
MKSLWTLLVMILCISFSVDARIRLRKVKEAPRVCAFMGEDKLLSRPDKKVLSTERHSIVFDENITLVKDKGEKICSWRPTEFDTIARMDHFSFYIDEKKEMIYPHAQMPDGSVMTMKVSLADCSLENRVTLSQFEIPKCEKTKSSSKRKHKKKKA